MRCTPSGDWCADSKLQDHPSPPGDRGRSVLTHLQRTRGTLHAPPRNMATLGSNKLIAIVASASVQLADARTEEDATAILQDHLIRLDCPDSLVSLVRENEGKQFVVGTHVTGRFDRIRELTVRRLEGPAENEDILSMVVRNSKPVFIADSGSDSRFDSYEAFVSGIRSQYIVPLRSQESALGTLQVSSNAEEPFSEAHRAAIEVVACTYATVLARIRTFAKLEAIKERLKQLADGDLRVQPNEQLNAGHLLPRRNPVDHTALVSALRRIKAGSGDAHAYHSLILELLQVIFNPYLCKPRKEQAIHEGRKRIDIVFNNGRVGFFGDLVDLHRIKCPYVFVECKNYSVDLTNPELDQLAGRFSDKRGRFGILVCRRIADREHINRKCRDAVNDGRGYILVFDDADIEKLLAIRGSGDEDALNSYLDESFRMLVM
jgi:GAF domain-containing protein